jgi:hypothetical protein
MKEFGVLIPKLHYFLSISLFPICILHGKKVPDVSFYDSSKYGLLRLQISKFFKPIKEGNGHIAVGYQLREIGKNPWPKFSKFF